jgi:hypothetical protein
MLEDIGVVAGMEAVAIAEQARSAGGGEGRVKPDGAIDAVYFSARCDLCYPEAEEETPWKTRPGPMNPDAAS